MRQVAVIPTKAGLFRVVSIGFRTEGASFMSESTYARWRAAWADWWDRKGRRLAVSPEMWLKESKSATPDA